MIFPELLQGFHQGFCDVFHLDRDGSHNKAKVKQNQKTNTKIERKEEKKVGGVRGKESRKTEEEEKKERGVGTRKIKGKEEWREEERRRKGGERGHG